MLLVVAALAFAALVGSQAWRLDGRRSRRVPRRVDGAAVSLLDTVDALVNASRASALTVLATLDRAIRSVDPSVDAVLVFRPAEGELTCVLTSGQRTEYFRAVRIALDVPAALPARAAIEGHRAVSRSRAAMLMPADRAAVAVPLCDRGSVLAVAYASSSCADGLNAVDDIVAVVAHAATPYAIALEREADRTQATYDGLTGLLTARAFRTLLGEELERRRFRPGGVLSLWFVDTDRFKAINDNFGHAAGDGVLHRMAALLRAHTVEGVDAVGRNGGDEFCALLYDDQKTIAIERAQRFCEAVRSHDFGIGAPITASIGVASFPHDASSASQLLEIADAAMYFSKRTGRDRVSFSHDGGSFSSYRD